MSLSVNRFFLGCYLESLKPFKSRLTCKKADMMPISLASPHPASTTSFRLTTASASSGNGGGGGGLTMGEGNGG